MRVATRMSPRVPSAVPARDRHPPPRDSAAPRTLGPRLSSPIGAIGGLFGGLLGIGGGSAIAPLLLLAGTLRPAQIAGTTLAAVLVISSVGTLTYASFGHMNLDIALPIALGSVAGSAVGALLAKRLSLGVMVGIFVLILPYFVLKEIWPGLAAPALAPNTIALVLLGLVTGLCSGLLGIGGASLVVPSLVAFFLIDHIAAQGIAMSVALADAAAGVAVHARSRNINYGVLLYIAPAALATAVAGAILSHYLPEVVLRYLFGVFMAVVWFSLATRWMKMSAAYLKRSPAGRP